MLVYTQIYKMDIFINNSNNKYIKRNHFLIDLLDLVDIASFFMTFDLAAMLLATEGSTIL